MVVSPTGDTTVPKFVPDPNTLTCAYYDGGQTVYQGSQSSGTILRDSTITYSFPSVSGLPYASGPRVSQVKTTLASGQSSYINTAYAPGSTFYETSCDANANNCATTNSFTNPVGGPTSKTYVGYDGTTLKQENIYYQWQAYPAYQVANFLDLPATTSITNGSSTTAVAQTSYLYDEGAYSPGGTRGHGTTAIHLLTSGSSSPKTHIGWNASGMKSYLVDANGNTTMYNYSTGADPNSASGFATAPTASCNGSEITSTVDALSETISGTYDCNTGLLLTLTDSNDNTTTVSYDAMRRIQSVTYPAIPAGTPVTSFQYVDSQNTLIRTMLASPDPTQTTQVVFDSFGREVHRYTSDNPSNDEIDTTYDLDGRVQSVTNPYRSGDAVYSTQYTYDALNRKTVVTNQDNSTTVTCFDGVSSASGQNNCSSNLSSVTNAAWTDTSDETGRHWQHVSDALGRLVAVMEPSPSTNTPTLQTNYAYDPLGNLSSVNQIGASTETAHVRSFTYDSLSRLVCASNPENSLNACPQSASSSLPSGVLRYTYDPNGNVSMKTDARGAWVQYGYDTLNRLIGKTYSDALTLPVSLTYGLPGTSVPNGVGRLVSETVSSGNNVISQRSPMAYDALGHITQLSECTPANCASTPYQLAYSYDLAGNEIASTNGLPAPTFNGVNVPSISLSMNYDPAGHLSLATSSWSDALAHPATLFQANSTNSAAPSYTAAGALENALLGVNPQTNQSTIAMTRTFDNRVRILSEKDNASALLDAPGTPASGSISITGSEQSLPGTATPATGTITITGQEGSHQVCTTRNSGGRIVQTCNTYADSGYLSVTVNNVTEQAGYGSGDTDPSVAASVANALNISGSFVTAISSGNVVTLTSVATGSAANYAYSVTNGSDFSGADSGSTLTGGSAGTPIPDTGIVTVTVNGTSVSVPWNGASSGQSLATAVANAITQQFSSVMRASPSGSSVGLVSPGVGIAANASVSCSVSDTSNPAQTASFGISCSSLSGGTNPGYSSGAAYSYLVASSGGGSGYDLNGDLLSVTDSVTGGWTYRYDNLNRLSTASGNAGTYNGAISVSGLTMNWGYDSFGNRLSQTANTTNLPTGWAQYGAANNQVVSTNTAVNSVAYDNAGNTTFDGVNSYVYDAEGRVCATGSFSSFTQYLYDGGGNRIAKGSINGLSCNLATNGFSLTSSYIYGSGNELLTEMTANGAWKHSDIYADGKLLASYADTNTYFALNDWLGTKRAEVSAAGCLSTFGSLPFGDDLSTVGNCPDATEKHFTGKEHDTETGNEYFGARYLSSMMGRWISPDWSAQASPVPYAMLDNPQSLNLYAYVGNNPLTRADADGHIYNGALDSAESSQDSVLTQAANRYMRFTQDDREEYQKKQKAKAQQQQPVSLARLTTIVYNETGSFSPNPNATPNGPGSAADLFNARVAVAEVVLTLFRGGHVKIGVTVASDLFSDKELAAFANKVPSVLASLSDTMEATSKAYEGSNYTNGATQYRTRTNGDVTGNLNRTKSNPGTPLSGHFGPFLNSIGPNAAVVIAP